MSRFPWLHSCHRGGGRSRGGALQRGGGWNFDLDLMIDFTRDNYRVSNNGSGREVMTGGQTKRVISNKPHVCHASRHESRLRQDTNIVIVHNLITSATSLPPPSLRVSLSPSLSPSLFPPSSPPLCLPLSFPLPLSPSLSLLSVSIVYMIFPSLSSIAT